MSIFRTYEIPCPSCQTPVPFELVHSVNAGRRPDLRDSILARTFQQQPCPSCGYTFRMEPELTYMDLGRGQFLAVWPAAKVADWQDIEQRSQQSFNSAYGSAAPAEAKSIGKKLKARAVFGWAALNEKLVADEAGIDDYTLELAKVGVIRNLDTAPVAGAAELRLLGVESENLVLGWIRTTNQELIEVVTVPKTILAEIESEAAAWKPLRDDLGKGMFVDYRRLLIAPAEMSKAAAGRK